MFSSELSYFRLRKKALLLCDGNLALSREMKFNSETTAPLDQRPLGSEPQYNQGQPNITCLSAEISR